MRRLAPLLLIAVPALCWAAPSDSEAEPKNGACVYARPATGSTAMADADSVQQARPPMARAARSTPKAAPTVGGGGGDGDTVVPRNRGNRWHSFLPGMFR